MKHHLTLDGYLPSRLTIKYLINQHPRDSQDDLDQGHQLAVDRPVDGDARERAMDIATGLASRTRLAVRKIVPMHS
jgi:hypothetical protein